ncbi:MAG: helix-turn-helix domain-containing protein [Tannerella sp.]|jgi:signal transduction histidine kinase/ligand-binding sensor domain-containing protein/DNA-binding response OmpR family regulator|nr:helix-turn-helix domain-containing protein [Tannerella sp.]
MNYRTHFARQTKTDRKADKIRLLITFFFLTYAVHAYNLRQLSNKEGLSNSAILSICQDSERFVWIGTADGLNMYNGAEITVFKPEINPLGSLSGNLIEDVWEGEDDIIWINTNHGLNCYNKNTKEIDSHNEFEGIYYGTKTSGNEVFVIKENHTIHYYERNRKKFIPIEHSGIVKDDIRKIFIDSSNTLWIITNKSIVYNIRISFDSDKPVLTQTDDFAHDCGLLFAFLENDKIYFIDKNYFLFEMDATSHKKNLILNLQKEVEERGVVSSIVKDNDDYLVAFQTNGVIRIKYTPENAIKYEVENIGIYCGVFCLHKDNEQDIIWIGTDGQGLYMYTRDQFSFRSFTFENLHFSIQKPVRALFSDHRQNLWIGTKDDGLLVINNFEADDDMHSKKITHFTTSNSLLNNNSIYAFTGSRRNILWIGNDGPGLNYYSYKEKKIKKLRSEAPEQIFFVHNICEINDTTLWLASVGSGIYKVILTGEVDDPVIKSVKRFTFEKEEMSYNFFFTACRENDSIVWFGNRGSGLRRLNVNNETFAAVKFPGDDIHTINDILSINRDSKGNIWVGTSFGILKLTNCHSETNEVSFVSYNEIEGLPNNTIHGILEDNRGYLWISTNDGLVRFDTENENFRQYNHKSGLDVFEFSDGAYMKDEKTGVLFFGGINGFVAISPDEYTKKKFVPRIFFTGLKIYDKKQNFNDFIRTKKGQKNLLLKHDQNFFSISFIAPDYINGQNCRYFYNLENFSSVWIENGNSIDANFTNISPGKYNLHVKCDNGDVVTDIYSLPIVILPPWYLTIWAYIIYFLLIFILLFASVQLIRRRYRLKREVIIEKMHQQQKEEVYESKLRFFTNITHEFSTPLTLIYGPCNRIISYEKSDGFIKKYANMIMKNTERLYSLIQELIEFRRIETGHKACLIEALNITELSNGIIDSFSELAESKNIHFQWDIEQDLSWNSDKSCVTKILTNLLSNAFKYTPDEGRITCLIRKENECLKLFVHNTGKGIREKDIPHIFDRYYILENLEKQTQKGFFSRNGLGLAICYNMVKLLDGIIDVKSIPDEYTEFQIILPYKEATMPDVQNAWKIQAGEIGIPTLTPSSSPRKNEKDTKNTTEPSEVTVFVIDDDPEMRWFISEIMKDKYNVISIENPLSVNSILETIHPQLIISDIMMPELDGISLMKQIKADKRTAHIPFILISAKNTPEEQTEGISAGAEAYIIKPFNIEYLQSVVERLLKLQNDLKDYYRSAISAFEFSDGKYMHKENKVFLGKILEVIDRNMNNPDFSTEHLAKELGVSARHLYRKLKEFTEQTPAGLIREYKLSVAEKLLITSKNSIDEIMYMAGFNHRGSFYNLFARKFGMTPKQYREAKINEDIHSIRKETS